MSYLAVVAIRPVENNLGQLQKIFSYLLARFRIYGGTKP